MIQLSRERLPVPLESPARSAPAAEWDFRQQPEADAVVPQSGGARAVLPAALRRRQPGGTSGDKAGLPAARK